MAGKNVVFSFAGFLYPFEVRQASHMDWSNRVCRRYDSVATCIASDDKSRVIDACGITFFDRYLSRKHQGVLERQNPGLSNYRYQL